MALQSLERMPRPLQAALKLLLRIAGTAAIFLAYLMMLRPLAVLYVNRTVLFADGLSAYMVFMGLFIVISQGFCWVLIYKLLRWVWGVKRNRKAAANEANYQKNLGKKA